MKAKFLVLTIVFQMIMLSVSAQTRITSTPIVVSSAPVACVSATDANKIWYVTGKGFYLCINNVPTAATSAKGSFPRAALPTSGTAGDTATVSDSTKGAWRFNGSRWVAADAGRRINLLDFCDPAASDNSVCLLAAINVLNGSTGGTIVFPTGYTFKIAAQINLPGYHNIIFEGTNTSQEDAGSQPNIECTMAGAGACFSMPGSHGIEFRGMHVIYSNPAFTGWLIQFGISNADAQKNKFVGSIFRGTSDGNGNPIAGNAAGLLNLQQSIIGSIRDCTFMTAKEGIRGRSRISDSNSPYSYSFVWQIENNTFNFLPKSAIFNADALWIITGNTFEPDENGHLVAISDDYPYDAIVRSMVFDNNYLGDNAASIAPSIQVKMLGGSVSRNWITQPWNGVAISMSGSTGAVINNNYFESNGDAQKLFAPSWVNASTDTVTMDSPHNFVTGNRVVPANNTEVAPAPLVFNTSYYVIVVSPTVFKFASSYANALAGTAIDLTSQGSDTHGLVCPAQDTAIYLNGVAPGNHAITIANNSGQAVSLLRTDGSNFGLIQYGNTTVQNGLLPAIFGQGVNFNGGVDVNKDSFGVAVGTAGDFSALTLGAAIRQSEGTADHPAGSLVIQSRGADNYGNIDFVTGFDSTLNKPVTKFQVGIYANTSLKPLKIGTSGTAISTIQSQTASLDFGATAANGCDDLDVAGFTALVDGDVVSLGIPFALGNTASTSLTAFVKNATTVTVRRCNAGTTAATDPAAATVRATVAQF